MHIQFRPFVLSAFLLSTAPAFAASTAALPAVPAALTGCVSDIDRDADRKSVGLAIDAVFAGKQKEGLLGFALHPEFGLGKDHDFVYVAYANDSGTSAKTVQYHWDAEAGTLGDPVDLGPDGKWVQGGEPRVLAVVGREGQGGEDYRESE